MTGITNATINPKDGRMSRLTTPRSASKPFVVCSMSTKRYAESKTNKTPVQRLSPTVRPTFNRDGPHVPKEAPTKQAHRPGPVFSTATKTEVCRSFTKPALAPDPGETRTMLKKSVPFSRLTSKDRALSQKTIGSEPTKVVERSKEHKITCGYPAPVRSTQLTITNESPPRPSCVPRGRVPRSSVGVTPASKWRQEVIVKAVVPCPRNLKPAIDNPTTRTAANAMGTGSSVKNPSVSERHSGVPSTQTVRLALCNPNPVKLTTANDPFPRPSCVPRGHVPRSFVDATLASKGRQEVIVKAVTPRPRNPGIKPSVDIPTTRTRVYGMGTGSFVKNPSVSERHHVAPSTRNESSTLRNPVMYPDINWSPPPSPDLSSFPSQSWTIAISVDVNQAKTTTVYSDETPRSTRETEESGTPDMPNDCCGSPESASTSPALSSSSTVVSTPPNPEMCMSGADNTPIGSLRKGPYVEASPTECTAKIISQSRNSSTSTDTLAKIIERGQVGSPIKNSDAGSGVRMRVQSAIEIARNLFSRSQGISQSTPETAAVMTTGTDVSRVRKLFIPPLEKDTRAFLNPMIQKEIEMLRARKQVAGGGVVDPRLERLGSLSAMAIMTKYSSSSRDRV